MSARPGRWDLLGHGSDPVLEDDVVVARLARVYAETGETIAASVEKLRRLSDLDGWTGKAAERFAEAAEDVVGDLSAAEKRYVDAGEALRRFVTPVTTAREDSAAALQAAVRADERRAANAGNPIEGVAEPTSAQASRQDLRGRAHDDAVGDLGRAKDDLRAAVVALDRAAKTCAEGLSSAADHGKDGRWDNVKGSLRDFADWAHLDVVVTVLTVIAIAIAVVAIAVAMIVTAPAWLATALFVAGMAVGIASFAANATMAVSEHPDGSWTNVALDLVGIATLGASRAFTSGARATVAATRGDMATSAAASARTQEAARIAATHPSRSQLPGAMATAPGNNLRIWAQEQKAIAAAQAATKGDDAARAVSAPVQRKLQEEVARLQALPAPSPAVTEALDAAVRQIRVSTVVGYGGDAGTLVNAADLAYPVVDRFDEWLALTEWRLSR